MKPGLDTTSEAVGAGSMRPEQSTLIAFPDPPGFSGQRASSELVIELLGEKGGGMSFIEVRFPGLPSGRWRVFALPLYGLQLCAAVLKAAWVILLRRPPAICINLSQSVFGLIREGTVAWLARWCPGYLPRQIVSLNGSNFMTWEEGDRSLTLFRNVVRDCDHVTVVGPTQRERLEQLGLPVGQAVVVPNTCELTPLDAAAVEAKHRGNDGAVGVLHLSTLMEAKGYPLVVDAAEQLAGRVDTVICGLLAESGSGCIEGGGAGRFRDIAEAEAWLREKAAGGDVRWIEGARGTAKAKLFEEALVFVFPSVYLTEAQPLVLLEAMASGCVVITTTVGEIGWMLDETMAVLLSDKPTLAEVADAIDALVKDPQRRIDMALAARERFLERFGRESYRESWKRLLTVSDS